jgi:stage IV sporulation protein B
LKCFFQRIAKITFVLTLALFTIIGYWTSYLPDRYTVTEGQNLLLNQSFLSVNSPSSLAPASANQNQNQQEIRLMGFIPLKTVSVQQQEEITLIPSGSPFGIKMFTKGAMIVGMENIATANGSICPGKEAGLMEGDMVLEVNHKEITRNEEAAAIIEKSGGKPLLFTIQRNGEEKEITLNPVVSTLDGTYKTGIWIRDSAAGIGTITYIDPKNNVFAGLGHAICDVDTGEVLPVGSGEVCDVEIQNIKKGENGTPGELQGVFTSNTPFGTILENNQTGIYGKLLETPKGCKTYPMAHKQEVKTGEATVLCMLEDGTPKEYSIEIISVDYKDSAKTKNMTIRVTDPELISLTGGIVQGMSGSPILQNGKLVGAVTHVFVNDPEKGYGIFAENMYETAQSVIEQKQAS